MLYTVEQQQGQQQEVKWQCQVCSQPLPSEEDAFPCMLCGALLYCSSKHRTLHRQHGGHAEECARMKGQLARAPALALDFFPWWKEPKQQPNQAEMMGVVEFPQQDNQAASKAAAWGAGVHAQLKSLSTLHNKQLPAAQDIPELAPFQVSAPLHHQYHSQRHLHARQHLDWQACYSILGLLADSSAALALHFAASLCHAIVQEPALIYPSPSQHSQHGSQLPPAGASQAAAAAAAAAKATTHSTPHINTSAHSDGCGLQCRAGQVRDNPSTDVQQLLQQVQDTATVQHVLYLGPEVELHLLPSFQCLYALLPHLYQMQSSEAGAQQERSAQASVQQLYIHFVGPAVPQAWHAQAACLRVPVVVVEGRVKSAADSVSCARTAAAGVCASSHWPESAAALPVQDVQAASQQALPEVATSTGGGAQKVEKSAATAPPATQAAGLGECNQQAGAGNLSTATTQLGVSLTFWHGCLHDVLHQLSAWVTCNTPARHTPGAAQQASQVGEPQPPHVAAGQACVPTVHTDSGSVSGPQVSPGNELLPGPQINAGNGHVLEPQVDADADTDPGPWGVLGRQNTLVWAPNAGLVAYPSWQDSLQLLAHPEAPLFMTTDYCEEALVKAQVMASHLFPTLKCVLPIQPNPLRQPWQRAVHGNKLPAFSNGFITAFLATAS